MIEGYLESRGIAYRTNEFKDGRPTLVFIHGLSGSLSAWYPYEKIFENRYNIVTFDLRGHGLSKKFSHYSDYEIKLFVEDIQTLLVELKIEKYIIVAHSFGTLIALQLMISSTPTKALLLSPVDKIATPNTLIERILIKLVIFFASLIGLLPQLKKKGTRIDYSSFRGGPDWDMQRMYTDISNTGLRVYLYCFKQGTLASAHQAWQSVSIPTLVMQGEDDKFSSFETGVNVSKAIPHAQLVAVKNAGHMLVNNQITEVTQAIEDFISR